MSYPTKYTKTVGDFVLRAWLVSNYVASFEVIQPICFGYERDGKRFDVPQYKRRGAINGMDMVEDIDNAETLAHGGVKWDGCTDFIVEEGNDCMAHTCSVQSFRELLDAVKAAHEFAASLLDATHPVREEYAEIARRS